MAILPMTDERHGPFRVSAIVPVAPGEDLLDGLDGSLQKLPDDFEVVYVANAPRPAALGIRARWLVAPANGRAAALNAGAEASSGEHLWFLHADTRLPAGARSLLLREIARNPCALLYFGLRFYNGGGIMRVNEIGVALRCTLFRAPFGDQALCVPHRLHKRIGGFDTAADYGEDHLYVRAARRCGAELVRVAGTVGTSARKYRDRGWVKVVVEHQLQWIRQAWSDRGPGG